ncbi:hypothetical protein F4780DRAFT_782139 [Xylariomycetidae sp. FL0641]|nr:hypothetical protein F4780DRAFT_782139 [Xylariomycetidae sp. FL0641]
MPCHAWKSFAALFQRLSGGSKSRPSTPSEKFGLQISEPFDFRKEETHVHGVSQDQLKLYREQAAARVVGCAPNDFANRPPAPPVPLRPITPTLQVTPSTPVSPADNLI